MTAKRVITAILLAFASVSVAYVVVDELRTRQEDPAAPEESTPVKPVVGDRTIAYYFHGDVRCNTCEKIEAYTRDALFANFDEAIKNGRLDWRIVNTDKPENEHFVEDFQLTTRSVVLVDMDGEAQTRWKNLDRIWDLVGRKKRFQQYIIDETMSYLTEDPGE
jgi:hypothetical protein